MTQHTAHAKENWPNRLRQTACPLCEQEIHAMASCSGFVDYRWSFLGPDEPDRELVCFSNQYIHIRVGAVHKLVYQKPRVRNEKVLWRNMRKQT